MYKNNGGNNYIMMDSDTYHSNLPTMGHTPSESQNTALFIDQSGNWNEADPSNDKAYVVCAKSAAAPTEKGNFLLNNKDAW